MRFCNCSFGGKLWFWMFILETKTPALMTFSSTLRKGGRCKMEETRGESGNPLVRDTNQPAKKLVLKTVAK